MSASSPPNGSHVTWPQRLARIGVASVIAVAGCSKQPPMPTAGNMLTDVLPETTQIAGEWTAPGWDTGDVDDGWIESFGDDELAALVDEAIANNLNLQIAGARVERAEGAVQLAEAGLRPAMGVGAESAHVTGGGGVEREAGATVSWEADVWGRLQAGVDAAEQSLVAAQADYDSARLSLAAQTARAWFLAQELQMQVEFSHEMVDVLSELTGLARKQFDVGAISRENVDLAAADLAAAEEALRRTVAAQTQTVRALELMLGRYPAASLEASGTLVAVPPSVPAGMPSELLERRPDLVAAERRVAAAFRLEEQARLARMPSFTISGGLGGATSVSGVVGNLLAGVTVPLYAPALNARIAIASADQQAALAAYGQAVLRALEEVETALFNDHIFMEREEFLAAQVESNLRALEVYRVRFDVGKISILPLLQVQARYIGSQVLLTRMRNERLAQRVDLHLALGGSF